MTHTAGFVWGTLPPMPPTVGQAYRYVEKPVYYDRSYNPEYDDPHYVFSHMEVRLQTYNVIKFTPKGFWINYNGEKRFVLTGSHKRFACLTKTEALESFIRRKTVHASYAQKRLSRVEEALKLGERMLDRMKKEEADEAEKVREGAARPDEGTPGDGQPRPVL